MATYIVNQGKPGMHEVEAYAYKTEGEFVDFFDMDGGDIVTTFRIRAELVRTVHRLADRPVSVDASQ